MADAVKNTAIRNLRGASWQNAEFILQFLYEAKTVQFPDFLDILAACSTNFAVVYSDRAIGYLSHYRDAHLDSLSMEAVAVKSWNKILERYRQRKEDEKHQMEETLRAIEKSQKEQLANMKAATGPHEASSSR